VGAKRALSANVSGGLVGPRLMSVWLSGHSGGEDGSGPKTKRNKTEKDNLADYHKASKGATHGCQSRSVVVDSKRHTGTLNHNPDPSKSRRQLLDGREYFGPLGIHTLVSLGVNSI
jgi:hypothetical protein